MPTRIGLLIICLTATMEIPLAFADGPPDLKTLSIGDPAPHFTLPGIDDRDWSLRDFDKADVLIVYFTSNHCPVCHAQDPRFVEMLQRMAAQYPDQQVAVVAINPNSGDGLRLEELGYSKYDDSFEDMKLYARDEGFTFPYLYDGETQTVAKSYGCLATPHVFVFDRQQKLAYKGWLDDSRFPGEDSVKRRDAENAVVALLSNKPIEVAETKPFGCSTKWREKIAAVQIDNDQWENAPVTLESIDAAGIADLVANPTDKYRLFNVWSTTCGPCVEEFPGLIRVSRRMGMRSFELITISTDLPRDTERAKTFLSKMRAALPSGLESSLAAEGRTTNNYLYKESSMDDLITALDPAWQGPQPHTILVAPGGKIVFRHNGKVDEAELLDAILAELSPTYLPSPG